MSIGMASRQAAAGCVMFCLLSYLRYAIATPSLSQLLDLTGNGNTAVADSIVYIQYQTSKGDIIGEYSAETLPCTQLASEDALCPFNGEYTLEELLDYTGDSIVTIADVIVLIEYLASSYQNTIGNFDASTLPCYAKVSTNDACISDSSPPAVPHSPPPLSPPPPVLLEPFPPSPPIATGDAPGSAIEITVPSEVYGSTNGLTNRADMLGFGGKGPDVYFKFTSPKNTKLYIDTCESDFDTVLGIFSSQSNIYEPSSVSYMKTNDDGVCTSDESATGSTIVIDIIKGSTYFIMVDGFAENSAGWFVLKTKIDFQASCKNSCGKFNLLSDCDCAPDCLSDRCCQDICDYCECPLAPPPFMTPPPPYK